jgi:hypothetical protein
MKLLVGRRTAQPLKARIAIRGAARYSMRRFQIKGYFDKTLPDFLVMHSDPFSFVPCISTATLMIQLERC